MNESQDTKNEPVEDVVGQLQEETPNSPGKGVNLNFGIALRLLKQCNAVSRAGWNGKGMYIFIIGEGGAAAPGCKPIWTYTNGLNDNFPLLPFIAMKTADDKVVPWLASQTDILAEDWTCQ